MRHRRWSFRTSFGLAVALISLAPVALAGPAGPAQPAPDDAAVAAAFPDGPPLILTPGPLIAVGQLGSVRMDNSTPVYETRFWLPPQLQVIDVVTDGRCSIEPAYISCYSYTIEINFTAIKAGNDLEILSNIDAMEAGQIKSRVELDVFDPNVLADVHPFIDGPALARVGIPIVFDAEVANSGSTPMADTVATFAIDPALRVDAATWGDANPCAIDEATVICSIGTAGEWSNTSITLDITPVAVSAAGISTVTVTSSTPQDDPDPFADSADVAVDVIDEEVTDLGLEISIADTHTVSIAMGIVATFTNYGPTPLESFQFDLKLTGNYYIASGFYSVYRCTRTDLTASCRGPALAVGQSIILPVRAWPTEPGQPGTLTATAGTAYGEFDPDPHPNTIRLDLPAPGPPEAAFAGSFTHDDDPRAMQSYDMAFTVTNDGPSHATDTTMTITAPNTWLGAAYYSGARCAETFTATSSTFRCRIGRFVSGTRKTVTFNGFPLQSAGGNVVEAVLTSNEVGPDGPLVLRDVVDIAPAADPILTSEIIGAVRSPVDANGVAVFAFSDTDGFIPTAITTVGTDNRYSFDALPAGRYRLAFVAPQGSGLALQWLGASNSRTGAQTEFAFGDRANQLRLYESLGVESVVSGVVKDVDSNPIANTPVWVFAADTPWLPVAVATTAPDGSYSVGRLAAGSYQLYVPRAGPRRGVWFPNVALRSEATIITLASGETRTDIDVTTGAVGAGYLLQKRG